MKGRVAMSVRVDMRTQIEVAKTDIAYYDKEIESLQEKIDTLLERKSNALDHIEECEKIIMALNRIDWEEKGFI